jgi:tetratricopeptide (TPR) repeat protein
LPAVVALLLWPLPACNFPEHRLAGIEREIEESTRAIEAALGDGARAQGHSARARSRAEWARYARTIGIRPLDECERAFDRAVEDHDRAVALAPGETGIHLERGRTLYTRAALDEAADPKVRAMLDAAAADLTMVLDREPRNEQALDLRGLVHFHAGEWESAIADFTREMEVNPQLGRARLADTHCNRGMVHQREERTDLAIADYEKAIELGAPDDGCSCDSRGALAYLRRQ